MENTINNSIGNPPIDWNFRDFQRKVIKANPLLRKEVHRDDYIRKSYDAWTDSGSPTIRYKTEELQRLQKERVKHSLHWT
ncbi:MAG: hypothetical protein IPJ20_19660 [Flammeovirgaceae bacterium]|nr:hypothetical protein [Flammeovirgaceae bacterium]